MCSGTRGLAPAGADQVSVAESSSVGAASALSGNCGSSAVSSRSIGDGLLSDVFIAVFSENERWLGELEKIAQPCRLVLGLRVGLIALIGGSQVDHEQSLAQAAADGPDCFGIGREHHAPDLPGPLLH